MKYFLSLLATIAMSASVLAEQHVKTIRIDAGRSSIELAVGKDGRLYQTRFADVRMGRAGDSQPEEEAYIPAGERSLLEPALRIQHADGNTSTALEFVGVKTSSPAPEWRKRGSSLRTRSIPSGLRFATAPTRLRKSSKPGPRLPTTKAVRSSSRRRPHRRQISNRSLRAHPLPR